MVLSETNSFLKLSVLVMLVFGNAQKNHAQVCIHEERLYQLEVVANLQLYQDLKN